MSFFLEVIVCQEGQKEHGPEMRITATKDLMRGKNQVIKVETNFSVSN